MKYDFYNSMGYDPRAVSFVEAAQEDIKGVLNAIEEQAEFNQARVLKAFNDLQVSDRHFLPSTGYGYGDDGRETLDKLYAKVFECEDALVRTQWASGTHVLSDSLFALLRPGDTLLSITGRPYDTLNDVIGTSSSQDDQGSLLDWGINYQEVPLTDDGEINLETIKEILLKKQIKLIFIQRSRGYNWRPSLKVQDIRKAIETIKKISPNTMILVDNCYGEFTESAEPSAFGADLAVGSLIKNPGGGIAPTGAYATGTKKAVELLASRLTSPGLGREVGSYSYGYVQIYQGLFMAPHIVGQSLKGVTLAGSVFKRLGYTVTPSPEDTRSDIIQSIKFNSGEELIDFCQAVQASSPVDSHVVPYPWEMPGYEHKVIMAAGTFIQGSSIELSADAPIKEPYIAYLQGGLTFTHMKLALMNVLTVMMRKGYIKL